MGKTLETQIWYILFTLYNLFCFEWLHWESHVTQIVVFCATRLQTRQQVNSSLRELHVWPLWLSLLFSPSLPLSFHILALAAPQLLRWHQVSVNMTLQT